MLGSSSLFGSPPKRKREDTTAVVQPEEASASLTLSDVIDSSQMDEESCQIVEYFEKRDADQQQLIDELTKGMEELNLERSMEHFMSKLAQPSSSDSVSSSAGKHSLVDDKRLKQIKRMQQDESVVLNVGGRLFYSTMKTLTGEGHIVQTGKSLDSQEHDETTFSDKKSFDNLFKVMFSSTFSIQYDTSENGIKAINFEDRNPDHFEYILEHLRCNRRVKCLGLEDLTLEKLRGIKEESEFFLTEKLTNYIDKIIFKKPVESGLSHPSLSSFTSNPNPFVVKPIPIKQSLPAEWLDQFKKLDQASKQRMFELIDTTKAQISLTKQQIIDLSNSLREKLVEFMSGNNDSDMSIKLDVSGTCFNIPFRVFKEHKEFILYDFVLSENFALTTKGTIFIDRNPELFQLIHSYLIGGNFNNFPVLTPSNKKRLRHEALFFGLQKLVSQYFDDCRYPIETIGAENIKLKEQEDYLRELFVKDRNNSILDDKYLLLAPIFAMQHQIDGPAKDKYAIPNCPRLLDFSLSSVYTLSVSEPVMVKSLDAFQCSWKGATGGLLEGLDWSNVFAAGGMVLGCLLDGNGSKCIRTYSYSRYGRYRFNNENDKKVYQIREKENSDDEEEGFEEPSTIISNPTLTQSLDSTNPSSTELMSFPYTYQHSDYNFNQSLLRATTTTTSNLSHPNLYGTQSIFGAHQMPQATSSLAYNMLGFATPAVPLSSMPTLPMGAMSGFTTGVTMPGFTPVIGMMPGSGVDLSNSSSRPPSQFDDADIDIFLYGLTAEQAEDKLRQIYQVIKNNSNGNDVLVVRTQFTVTFYSQKTIQVILRLYKSPAEVLLGFDICAACVGYDGSQVWSNARARRALSQKTNLIDPDRMSTSYEARLYKYAKRGFSVSVPGYDAGKIKNHFLMFPRIYRSKHIDVRGLARILLMDYANRSPKTAYILSEYERNKALQKQIARDRLLQYFDKEFKSDYDDIPIYSFQRYQTSPYNPGQALFNRFKSRVDLFKTISKIPNWKPYYIFSLNDIETVINDTSNSSNLSEKVQWIEVDPGSQRIGSFRPVMSNFYSDAYNFATSEKPTLTKKKRTSEQTYTAVWSWEKNISAHTFDNYSIIISNKIEIAYRQYLTMGVGAPSTVPIMDNYHIDFTSMQQINSSDPSRRRKVKRASNLKYITKFVDVPVGELSAKTYY